MTIVDPVQKFLEAMVAIIDNDADLRTLLGRTSVLVVPADTLRVAPELPMLVFKQLPTSYDQTGYTAIDIELSCFAATTDVASNAIARFDDNFVPFDLRILTYTQFKTLSVNACPNPTRLPVRDSLGVPEDQSDDAPARSDITLSFLLSA